MFPLTLWQNQVLFNQNLKSDQIFPAHTSIYIILSCFYPLTPQQKQFLLVCSLESETSSCNVHHFVMFPLTLQHKQFPFGRNVQSDQISPACTSTYIILSCFHSLCGKTVPKRLQSRIWSNFSCIYINVCHFVTFPLILRQWYFVLPFAVRQWIRAVNSRISRVWGWEMGLSGLIYPLGYTSGENMAPQGPFPALKPWKYGNSQLEFIVSLLKLEQSTIP